MTWVAFVQAILQAVGSVFGFLDRKQIRDGGKAEAKVEGYEKSHKARTDADNAIRSGDPGKRLRDDWNRDK